MIEGNIFIYLKDLTKVNALKAHNADNQPRGFLRRDIPHKIDGGRTKATS